MQKNQLLLIELRLKDNSLAKMGYTTDYSAEICDKTGYDHENVDVDNNSIFDVRFRFIYKREGTNNSVTGGIPP